MPPGSYTLTASATDNQGAFKTSAPVLISVNPSGGGGPTFTGLALWLTGDSGLTLNGSSVSAWADQSGQGRDAVQGAAASQPTLVTTGLGKPGLRFDGANDSLTFTLPVNELTGMTIFLVANSRTAQAGGPFQAAIFWNETASWGTVYLSPFQNQVNFRFGTTQVGNSHNVPRSASIGSDYSITTSIHNETVDSLYVNGALLFEAGDKSPALAGNRDIGSVGGGFNNTYFAGDVLEVLVYARALSDTERQSVEQYLQTKYLSNQLPTVSITSPTDNASFTAPASITITAQAADTDGTISKVEFFRGSTKLGEDTTGPDYSFTWNDVPGGNYALTATATDNAGAYKASSAIQILVTSPSGPPFAGLGLWLKADAGVTLNGSNVSHWADQSGLGRDAVQATVANQPTLVSNGPNGKPTLSFDGIDDFLTFSFPVNGLTGMSIVLVANSTAPAGGGGSQAGNAAIFWNETASWGTVYLSPFQDQINWRFGTTQVGNRQIYVRPTTLGSDYSISTILKNETVDSLYINGELAETQSDKLPSIAGCRDIGNLGRGFNDNTFFAGEIAEVLVYTRALSDAERQVVEQYLKGKYAGRVTDGLQVLYTFSEGSGNTITDSSGTGTPLNLTIANPSAVRWLSGGGLALDSSALLASVDPATKVIDSSKAANEITIEAWIKPANTTQAGPARIVSVSRDSLNRNFTLGQQGADYQTRLRTTATGNNGSNPSVTAAGLASIQLSHVVYTRDAAGAVKFYLNGVAQATSTDTIAEDFSNWDGTMRLALANELTSDRPWLGELHLAAVYSRALTQAEAMQNFSVGAPTTPQVTAPAMSIALSGNTVVIAWPVSAAGFNLQTTDNLTTPNWSLVPGSPVVVGDENTATLQIGGSAGFYRLRK